MNAHPLDALATLMATGSRRRSLLATCGAAVGMVILPHATLACKKIGKKCDKDKDCCDGAKCKKDKCTCEHGWKD